MTKVYTEAEIQAIKESSYLDGAQSACKWLEEVYGEGIRETDAWTTYMKEAK